MKSLRNLFLILLSLGMINLASAQDLIVKQSKHNQKETIRKLKSEMKSRDLNLVQHVKHSDAAQKAKMDLPPTDVLIFGNPEVGTKLMQSDPKVAIELPLRILVYEENGVTYVAFQDPERLSQTYQLGNQREVLSNMRQVLDGITNEVIR